MHEAFNLGLDPSLDPLSRTGELQADGALAHSPNLWPKEEDWVGAAQFVRLAIVSG